MCVILIAKTARLTKSVLERAIGANADGNGVAWIENGTVRFRKGLTAEQTLDIVPRLPTPYVFHARIATVGNPQRALTHPFPCDPSIRPDALSGRTKRGVLFHNGTWHSWEDYHDHDGLPVSDSRVMADLVAEYGWEGVTDLVGTWQRVVLVTPTKIHVHGDGWTEPIRGIVASNTHWQRDRRRPARMATQQWLDLGAAREKTF